jgi:mono/diheme cytochrome c family protein
MRGAFLYGLLGCLLTVGLMGPALAAQTGSTERRGEALLTTNCARCHAVGRSGVSPHPQAPPFRTLSRRFKIEGLAEALAEGIVTGHPDMPEFVFEADEVGAIIKYLNPSSSGNSGTGSSGGNPVLDPSQESASSSVPYISPARRRRK